jgi:hypothetical protein
LSSIDGWIRRSEETSLNAQCEVIGVRKVQSDVDILNPIDPILFDCVYDRGSISLRQALLNTLNIFKNNVNSFIGTLGLVPQPVSLYMNNVVLFSILEHSFDYGLKLCQPLVSASPLIESLQSTDGNQLDIIKDYACLISKAARGIQLLSKVLQNVPEHNTRSDSFTGCHSNCSTSRCSISSIFITFIKQLTRILWFK